MVALGGWLDLAQRSLTLPPEALRAILRGTPRAAGFEDLPRLRR